MMRTAQDRYANGPMRDYIFECFRRLGKRLDTCEQCGIIGKLLDIHHTKYKGATVYDLQLVCRSCNLKAGNRGLI